MRSHYFYRRQIIKDTNLLWEELERGVVAATEDIWNVKCVKLGVPRGQRCLNVLLCGTFIFVRNKEGKLKL